MHAKQLTFSKEYTAAVEAKQVAQQEAERAKFIVGSCWHSSSWDDCTDCCNHPDHP
jgi:hypothetical protein